MPIDDDRQAVAGVRPAAAAAAVLALVLCLPGGIAAQDSTAAPPPPAGLMAGPVKVSGFVTGSYTVSTNPGPDDVIVGRFYDRYNDQFMANSAKIVAELAPDPAKFAAGFRVDFLFGQNAEVTQARGFNLGSDADLLQAMAILNIPAGSDASVKIVAGKMETVMGMELIEDALNPNWSLGNQFVYVENLTNTGIGADVTFGPKALLQVRYFNGWDLVKDNNAGKSFMGRFAYSPSGATTLGLVGYVGPEQEGTTANLRYGGELLLIQKLGSRAQLWAELDYGEEEFDAPAEKATWWGAAAWLVYDIVPVLQLALRGDLVDDRSGVRTSGLYGWPANDGNRFGSATATLNVKAWKNALIRPEVRYDQSTLAAFDGSTSQVTFALATSFLF